VARRRRIRGKNHGIQKVSVIGNEMGGVTVEGAQHKGDVIGIGTD